jgi:hypothetical protein
MNNAPGSIYDVLELSVTFGTAPGMSVLSILPVVAIMQETYLNQTLYLVICLPFNLS